MDIFFCDLCGARVTDADLRAGHGTRRRWDVICGTCLEQGHGQEWLSARAGVKPAVAAAVAAAAPDSPAPSAAAGVLDLARDRARTLEQEEEAERIVPQAVAQKQTAVDDTDVASAPVDHVATTRVPSDAAAPDLASASETFARLGSRPMPANDDPEMRDDLIDDIEKDLPAGITPTPAPAVSPFAFDDKKKERTGATGASAKSGSDLREPKSASGMRKSPSGVRAKTGSGSISRPAPAAKGGKSSSGKITKRRPAQDDSGRTVLKYTAISGLVLLLLMGAFLGYKATQTKGGGTTVFRPQAELEKFVTETSAIVNSALASKDPAALKKAGDRIDECAAKVDAFEKIAQEQKPPWTEDQINYFIEKLKWQRIYMLQRNIRDELVKQQAQ
ncbi:MAG TPA: hypothetical protein VEL07_14235 [Planctomycetota bacterium]|nr:hypothetical protein [Planctomycetota bacterium]